MLVHHTHAETYVSFIPYFVFGFWSLLVTKSKIWKYFVIFVSILQGRQKRKENHTTVMTKIPKTQKRKYGMNKTLLTYSFFHRGSHNLSWNSLFVPWQQYSALIYLYIHKKKNTGLGLDSRKRLAVAYAVNNLEKVLLEVFFNIGMYLQPVFDYEPSWKSFSWSYGSSQLGSNSSLLCICSLTSTNLVLFSLYSSHSNFTRMAIWQGGFE